MDSNIKLKKVAPSIIPPDIPSIEEYALWLNFLFKKNTGIAPSIVAIPDKKETKVAFSISSIVSKFYKKLNLIKPKHFKLIFHVLII
jgi:hypothetical protein